MQAHNFLTSSCRYCRYYQGQGRRGGTCQQLNVPVDAHWQACALAARPFHNEWQEFDDFVRLEQSLVITPAPVPPNLNQTRQPIAV